MRSQVDDWDKSPAAEAARRVEIAMVDAWNALQAKDEGLARSAAYTAQKGLEDVRAEHREVGAALAAARQARFPNSMDIERAQSRYGQATRNVRLAREFARRAQEYADAAKIADDNA